MSESMKGLRRDYRAAEVKKAAIGDRVTVMGWVQKSRNKGGIIFTDLRDRSGILQIIFEEKNCGAEVLEKAARLRSEFVIAVTGTVAKRAGAVNKVSTGFKRRPDILNYLTLTCGTHLHVLKAPVAHRNLILSEHTLTRAGGIDCNKVKHKT